MKLEFIGGTDVQRSLNHSDNRCVNLVPTLNDKGDIAAFYASAGLQLETTTTNGAAGSGIYTASNGRCFEVAGTTLYELIDSGGGVITTTSRGTVTSAPVSRMIDNGIELIIVNGIDGWLFTFATNTLKRLAVKTSDFTVTIANPAVFTTVAAHGLVAGDAIRLTTTTGSILSTSLLTALSPSIVSTVSTSNIVAVAPSNNFVYVANTVGSVTNGIQMYSRDSGSGLISPLSPPTMAYAGGGTFGSGFTLSHDGTSAYVTIVGLVFPSTIVYLIRPYIVNTTTGQLSANGADVTTGAGPQGITVAPLDDFLYCANSSANTIYQYSRNLSGLISPLTPATVACTGSPQEIAISTDGLFAYVSCQSDNTIKIFNRNIVTGLLTAATPASISCGGLSPIGLALSPDTNNPHLYVVNNGSANVAMFSRNSGTGALTALSTPTVATGTSPKKIICTAESVYVTNSTSNTISQFNRNASTGILAALSPATISCGNSPIGIAIAPDGKSVYACNSGDSTVSQYSRTATGTNIGLPTGLDTTTTYYVIAAGLTANNFEVSLTSGGTAVSTSGQQAGVHTYSTLSYGFPNGCKTVAYMNGRFAAIEPNTQNFYVSEVLNGSWWDPLNVQTVDSNPDFAIGATVAHQEYIVFCQNSGQVYYDSGAYPTPWVPNTAGIFEVGCSAPYSIVQMDNSVFWMGGNQTGDGIVWRLNGFTPMRISTLSIEFAIQQMSTITDAIAFGYQQDGHNFYVLSFPTGNKTFVFDINTNLWHERANFANGEFSRWTAQEHAYFAGKHLVLSYLDGKIYSVSNSVYTYGTEPRKWLRSFRVPTNTMLRERHKKLQIDCEMGVGLNGGTDPEMMLRYSDDGGHTWSKELWRSMGKIGEYVKRAIWYNLGVTKGQPRIYEVSGSDPVKVALLNAYLD